MRKLLKNKEKRQINEQISQYSYQFEKKDNVEIDGSYIRLDGKVKLFTNAGKYIPCLKLIEEKKLELKKIVVDMGAVKFVVNGADVMRPGITDVGEGIEAGDTVLIVDETHNKGLAIGEALFSGEEILSKDSGKVIKNLHHVGDEIYNL